MPRRAPIAELEAGIKEGGRASLSRAITLAESRRRDDRESAQELIARLLPEAGGAIRLGLTGVPGAGKSTAIEALGLWLIERGHRVAVLVIDPSSARSGGSILGDKTRMQKLSASEAFIRPTPSGGMLGGTARRTREAILLCEAAGFDVILVETVGVGQSEVELAEIVDCVALLLVPGAGDELQGIKRGIVELADVVAVNKADGERVNEAKRAAADYRRALRLLPPSTPGWATPVLTMSAAEGSGLGDLWAQVESHRAFLQSEGGLETRRAAQLTRWFDALLEEAVLERFAEGEDVTDAVATARAAVAAGELTVPKAVADVLGSDAGSG
ncbi:MAG: methylmalonyl Co-A mutase-associated GTPase MeaB [Solirubrobacterales bacterium]